MYGPAPPRLKKTDITRSRTGCLNCRARRKKCDEKQPSCTGCVRLGQPCQQRPSRLAFRSVSFSPEKGRCNSGDPSSSTAAAAIAEQQDVPRPEVTSQLSPVLSGVDNLLSLQALRSSGQAIFYAEAWDTHCIPGLHPALRRLTDPSALPPPVRDAVLAVSACRLSRMTPRRKPFDPRGTPGLSFKPDPAHQTVSCERYGSALQTLARWSDIATSNAQGFSVALTAMILLANLEVMNGDFRHFESHTMGIERLLSHLRVANTTKIDRWTCELIGSWTQARAHSWWRRFHFSTVEFHRSNDSMACSPWLASILDEADDWRAAIMASLCESRRLTSMAFLARWDSGVAASQAAIGPSADEDVAPGSMEDSLLPPTPAVDSQRATLNRWHDQLPLSELPIERFPEAPGCASSPEESFEMKPLQFTSHQAAMNYAYYVVCRLLLCAFAASAPELALDSPQAIPTNHKANSWALLLARIAAGLDWDKCIKLNTFVIGFSTLLIPCALYSTNTQISLWLQDWIEERYTVTALEEGSFPVLQGLQALRAINREHREGREVRALFTCEDDGGGTEATKYDSYNRQHLPSLRVYGRDTTTGRYYSRRMPL